MSHCRRASRRPAFVFAPIALAATLLCVAVPAPSWAQSGAARAAAAHAQAAGDATSRADTSIKEALIKAIGKDDGELFGNLLQTLGDGKSAFHVIAETTAEIKREKFTGTLSGRTEMRGNYGSAFVSDAELTVKQDEQTVTMKTRFVCDGQTLWTLKPSEDKYTEQSFTAARATLSDDVMEASFDLVGVLAAAAAKGFEIDDSKTGDAAYKVTSALFRGVPCRILTVGDATTKNDKGELDDRFRVYVGLDKRLRGLQFRAKDKGSVGSMTLTEIVKVMEPITPAPAPQDALFHFSPPAGAKKVESFDEGDE